MGTKESPGTIVCTITGRTQRHGVGEVQMGTPLGEVIEAIGGGPLPGRSIKAVLSGVANGIITADQLDTPVTYESLAAIGSGLGSAGFIVFDDETDMTSVAAGVARFLAVESCGQCSPCKLDGITLSTSLARLASQDGRTHDYDIVRHRLTTVADRSRCFLATQQQVVVGSIVKYFPDEFEAHAKLGLPPCEPELIAELVDIHGGVAMLDERHREKQMDWTYNKWDSGTVPVEFYQAVVPPWLAGHHSEPVVLRNAG
jgi:NADH:ubiquinone oxidoreductase subunit F (NADH-binding)